MKFSLSLLPLRRERPLTCLANPAEMQAEPQSEFFKLLALDPEQYRRGRKFWELDYISECAEKLGLLNSESKALGLGVGREALMFYFARKISQVVATDLYSSTTGWGEARAEDLSEIYNCSPFSYPRERLGVEVSDMRKLRFPDNSFELLWSCGSIEHVNGLHDIYLTLREAHRVLKPGGCAIITTEFCLSEPPFLYPTMNTMDAHLVSAFLGNLGGFELVGPVDLSFNYVHPLSAVRSRQYLNAPCTSNVQQYAMSADYVHLMGLSTIVPIGFVLRRRGPEFTAWEELPLDQHYRVYANVQSLGEQKDVAAALMALWELANSSIGTYSLQFHLQMTWLLLQIAHDYYPQSDLADLALNRFLDLLPSGELQDANILSYVAKVLAKKGDLPQALKLLQKAALSPSAFADHALSLAMQHLNLNKDTGDKASSDELLFVLIEDLLINGYSLSWINTTLHEPSHSTNSSERVAGIMKSAAKSAFGKMSLRLS